MQKHDKWVYGILAPEDNGSLSRRLMVVVPKQKDIISRLET